MDVASFFNGVVLHIETTFQNIGVINRHNNHF